MDNVNKSFSATGRWVTVLATIFIFLNALFFTIYQHAHPAEEIWFQAWSYVESTTFKSITVSIIFPLFMLIVEARFKLLDTLYKNRLDRQQKIKDERREKRLEGIAMTAKMWNQLYDLVTEIRFVDKSASTLSEITETQKKLIGLGNSGEDVVNIWSFRFTLSPDTQDLFLGFINMLLQSAESVAHHILESDSEEEIKGLQNALGVIQEAITAVAHHPLMNILKNHMALIEDKESGNNDAKTRQIQEAIDLDLTLLKNWAREIRVLHIDHDHVMSALEGDEVDAYREVAKRIEKWVYQNPDKSIDECVEYNEFFNTYSAIPLEKSIKAVNVSYSPECIKQMADWLGFQLQIVNLSDRSRWSR